MIDINDAQTVEDVIRILGEATGISNGQEDPNVVHQIDYKDYGIQVQTPEHYVELMNIVGTQIRKLITADIAEDAVLTVDGVTLEPIRDASGKIVRTSKQRWLEHYNSIVVENVMQSFDEISSIFKDKKEVEKLLRDEIRKSHKYDPDLMRACTLNEKGEFTIPLFDPIQSLRVQSLLSSVIKKTVTKQKIKGGSLIQVSSFGLTHELNIRWNDAQGNLIKNLEEFSKDYKGKNLE